MRRSTGTFRTFNQTRGSSLVPTECANRNSGTSLSEFNLEIKGIGRVRFGVVQERFNIRDSV
jgi:hypothetical protein